MLASLSEEQQTRLEGLLKGLSYPVAVKLLAAVERDRLVGATGLPHETLTDFLRPEIVAGGGMSRRTPTPQRLFCQPFEDLLIVSLPSAKTSGRIARSTLTPVWDWLCTDVLPSDMPTYIDKLTKAILNGNEDVLRTVLAELHRRAGGAMAAAIMAAAEEGRLSELSDRFGGAVGLDDVREIADIVAYGPEVMEAQERFPKPISHLTNEDVYDLRQYYQTITEKAPHMSPYFMLIMMGRLERPWEMVELTRRLSNTDQSHLIAGDAGLSAPVDSLIGDVERFAADFDADAGQTYPVGELFGRLDGFGHLAKGLISALDGDAGPWGRRIAAAEAHVVDAALRQMETALRDLRDVMKTRRAGGYAGPVGVRPDVSAPRTAGDVARADNAATLLLQLSEHVGFNEVKSAVALAIGKACDELLQYGGDLVYEIRAAEGAERQAARRVFDVVVALAERFAGEDEADLLRRRAAAAAQAA